MRTEAQKPDRPDSPFSDPSPAKSPTDFRQRISLVSNATRRLSLSTSHRRRMDVTTMDGQIRTLKYSVLRALPSFLPSVLVFPGKERYRQDLKFYKSWHHHASPTSSSSNPTHPGTPRTSSGLFCPRLRAGAHCPQSHTKHPLQGQCLWLHGRVLIPLLPARARRRHHLPACATILPQASFVPKLYYTAAY